MKLLSQGNKNHLCSGDVVPGSCALRYQRSVNNTAQCERAQCVHVNWAIYTGDILKEAPPPQKTRTVSADTTTPSKCLSVRTHYIKLRRERAPQVLLTYFELLEAIEILKYHIATDFCIVAKLPEAIFAPNFWVSIHLPTTIGHLIDPLLHQFMLNLTPFVL